MSTSWGTAAEEGARRLAAQLGVKDFVYEPVTIPKGRASREVSDGMLIVGDRGLILQTKARDPDAAADDETIRKWVTRKVPEAVGQVTGTRNSLNARRLCLRSLRGHERILEPPHSWPGVVILAVDHVPRELRVDVEDEQTVVMSLSDWHALHQMILSTSGVIDYVERVIQGPVQVDIGDEATRYRMYARADANCVMAYGGQPVLPSQYVEGEERTYAEIIGEWIDADIGISPIESKPDGPDRIRRTVEILDSIPILLRVEIGKVIAARTRESYHSQAPRTGLIWIEGTNDRILFYADVSRNWPQLEKYIEPHLSAYCTVRHERLNELRGIGGTLLLARIAFEDQSVWRTYVMANGAVDSRQIPNAIRWSINSQYGIFTPDGLRDIESIGPEEGCPCGSGDAFGQCPGEH